MPATQAGDAWQRIQKEGVLKWGADAEGGDDEHPPVAPTPRRFDDGIMLRGPCVPAIYNRAMDPGSRRPPATFLGSTAMRSPAAEVHGCGDRSAREARLSEKILLVLFGIVCTFAFTGCAYFRFGDRSTDELRKAREEQADSSGRLFRPGTVFYSE